VAMQSCVRLTRAAHYRQLTDFFFKFFEDLEQQNAEVVGLYVQKLQRK